MLQFNGKQEKAQAMRADDKSGEQALAVFNLRCPRNGKRTKRVFEYWRKLVGNTSFDFHHKPLSALNKRMGRRLRVIPRARIPANKVDACAL